MIEAGELPTAIFLLSSTMATAYSVLDENGYRIPDDVEIIGYSDGNCELLKPQLTVIDFS